MSLDDLPGSVAPRPEADTMVRRVDRSSPCPDKITRAEELRLQLAALVGKKRSQQHLPVKPIRLDPPAPPRGRDRSGIDHMALNAVLLQNAVQPEPVQTSLLNRDGRIALAGQAFTPQRHLRLLAAIV